ncbi:primosomal replication protein N [Pseudaquabacterium rugosum]|uniref:Primosomal replication protein N n=1 Tax=Pseudaquabacterium rugosum TaxID=2984194 RepID=A0ABU9BBN7_9BURK
MSAQLLERGALRYTPAGVPALDATLQHAASVVEDGRPRQISFEIKALGIGAITQALGALALGQEAEFSGFLGQTRNGRGLLFHITHLVAHPMPANAL